MKRNSVGIFDFTAYDQNWLIGSNVCFHCKDREQAEKLKLLLEQDAIAADKIKVNHSGIVEGWDF